MKRPAVALYLLTVMIAVGILSARPVGNDAEAAIPDSRSAVTFRLVLRELWQYQVTWMRSYIVSELAGLEDTEIVRDKLIKNQEKIGNAIKPYYGSMAGSRLAFLLREHIIIAVDIVRAKKSGNAQALKDAQERGRKYAERISDMLSRIKSPRWDKQYLKTMFYKHLEYIDRQVDFRLKKDWASEIKAYDDGLAHVLLVSDILAEGIVHRFPDQFKE